MKFAANMGAVRVASDKSATRIREEVMMPCGREYWNGITCGREHLNGKKEEEEQTRGTASKREWFS